MKFDSGNQLVVDFNPMPGGYYSGRGADWASNNRCHNEYLHI